MVIFLPKTNFRSVVEWCVGLPWSPCASQVLPSAHVKSGKCCKNLQRLHKILCNKMGGHYANYTSAHTYRGILFFNRSFFIFFFRRRMFEVARPIGNLYSPPLNFQSVFDFAGALLRNGPRYRQCKYGLL